MLYTLRGCLAIFFLDWIPNAISLKAFQKYWENPLKAFRKHASVLANIQVFILVWVLHLARDSRFVHCLHSLRAAPQELSMARKSEEDRVASWDLSVPILSNLAQCTPKLAERSYQICIYLHSEIKSIIPKIGQPEPTERADSHPNVNQTTWGLRKELATSRDDRNEARLDVKLAWHMVAKEEYVDVCNVWTPKNYQILCLQRVLARSKWALRLKSKDGQHGRFHESVEPSGFWKVETT